MIKIQPRLTSIPDIHTYSHNTSKQKEYFLTRFRRRRGPGIPSHVFAERVLYSGIACAVSSFRLSTTGAAYRRSFIGRKQAARLGICIVTRVFSLRQPNVEL